jgi:hypothetical protein
MTCDCGKVALVVGGPVAGSVWLQARGSGTWWQLAPDFMSYFRLLVVHAGVPRWQMLYTPDGADWVTRDWCAARGGQTLSNLNPRAQDGIRSARAASAG